MAKFYTELDESLQQFITKQKMFFTATAPEEGRINLSPKGMETFRCINNKTVAYLNLTGSGNETAAHLKQNGRITVMFCSFDEAPLILRLYGKGRSVYPHHEEWKEVSAQFELLPGARQIIVIDIESVQTSCGFAVPFYEFKGERQALRKFAETKGEDGMENYRRENNTVSIDGLPTGLLD